MSTLTTIQTKIRRLTGRPSVSQITDIQINEYINNFYLYDMPESLRLLSEQTVYEFMTTANVDRYDLSLETYWNGQENVPVVDSFLTLNPPIYVAGYEALWSQSREQFFRIYPQVAQLVTSVEGDGTPGPYTNTFANSPILQGQVTVGAIDNTGATVNCIDVPTNSATTPWNIINTSTVVPGSINYTTGVATVTFANNIPVGNQVTFSAVPYAASRPQAALYYSDTLTLRPVPDASYLVKINAYQRPTALLDGDSPKLRQWWQLLAYGASLKVFEDAQDPEGIMAIMPAYKNQERLVLRRTINQLTTQRSSTIYTEMTGVPYGNGANSL